jgi:DNA replication protein DnaC
MAWFEAKELLDASRAYPLGKGDVPEVIEACAASVLFFDEIGWERDPEVASLVLNERYKTGAPTIITSGKSPEELTAHYGAAVVRRMIEAGGKVAKVVNCFQRTPL